MKFSACGSWFGGDWYENVRAGAKNGFTGVEQLHWINLDLDKAKAVLDETGVTSTAIIMESNDPNDMLKISWSYGMVWEDSYNSYISAFRQTLDAAKKLGVPNIIATTGNARYDVSHEKQHDIVVGKLKELAHMAEEEGVTIILEPLNVLVDHKGFFLNSTDEAVHMIREVKSANCKVLFDIYHQQITEGNVIRNITKNIDYIGHFHIADNPGRKQPGTGELNYPNIFKAIKETGYDGWLAFECGSTEEIPALMRDMHELIGPYSD